MTDRDALRESGADIRRKLGIPDVAGPELAPGFSRLSDELCFGKLWARPGLLLEERVLVTLAALTSRQHLTQLETYAKAALKIGMSPRAVQEVMIHCAMYSGLPTAECSLGVVAEVLLGQGRTVPDVALPEGDLEALTGAGQQTKRALHAERSEAGYASPDSAAAGLYATAIQYGYGAIWSRPDLDRRERMICSLSAFTALELTAQQSKFFRSAPNVGLTREQVIEVIMHTAPYTGLPRALNALTIAEEALG